MTDLRCISCGELNPDFADECSKCGHSLTDQNEKIKATKKIAKDVVKSDSLSQFTKNLQEKCTPLIKDPNERVIEQIEKLLFKGTDPTESLDSFLMNAGTLIFRLFGISEVVIAIKDDSDGSYKYRLFFGMRKESEEAYKKISYTYEQTTSLSEYPRIKLSDYTEYYPAEYRPYSEGELETFNRPSQLEIARKELDEMIEGDYICVYFYGLTKKDILGWFELARTRDNRIPSRETLKWLDLLAAVTGRVVYERKLTIKQGLRQRPP